MAAQPTAEQFKKAQPNISPGWTRQVTVSAEGEVQG